MSIIIENLSSLHNQILLIQLSNEANVSTHAMCLLCRAVPIFRTALVRTPHAWIRRAFSCLYVCTPLGAGGVYYVDAAKRGPYSIQFLKYTQSFENSLNGVCLLVLRAFPATPTIYAPRLFRDTACHEHCCQVHVTPCAGVVFSLNIFFFGTLYYTQPVTTLCFVCAQRVC